MIKALSISLLIGSLFTSAATLAQNKEGVYNTDINRANKVDIKTNDGVIKIAKADNVFIGQIIVAQEDIVTPIFLSYFEQKKDSSGYVTYMEFSNPKLKSYNDINIQLKFNKPIESSRLEFTGMSEIVMHGESPDKLSAGLSAAHVRSYGGPMAVATIRSQYPIFVTIEGVQGAIN